MRPLARRSLVVASLALAALAVSLADGRSPIAKEGAMIRAPSPAPITGDAKGLEIRLSDASPALPAPPAPPANATPLSDREVDALLSRLAPIDEQAEDRKDAAMRPRSLPPPRAGATRLEAWPPPALDEAPPPAAAGPLEILRHAPAGAVDLAPRISLTFSQPMVAVGSHEAAAATLPATLTPQPPGAWRWAGSQLLVFEGPEAGRLPMATRYVVEVPAGTRSATGGLLAAAHRFELTTPPAIVETMQPQGESQVLDPLVVLVFNQRIDARLMLAHVTLEAAGQPVATRLVDPREASDADATAIRMAAGGDARLDRVLALRAVAPLPKDSACRVVVAGGAPSAEGPLTSTASQAFAFRTYAPLKITGLRCAWLEGAPCPPESAWILQLNNTLDPASLTGRSIRVEPEVADLQTGASGSVVVIRGAFRARTSYHVVVPPSLRDVHGQELGAEARLPMTTGPARTRLEAPGGEFVVLDPAGPPRYRVLSSGLRSLRVSLKVVDPERDWAAFHAALAARWQDERRRFAFSGRREAWSGTVTLEGDVDALTETLVDLGPALTKGLGHVVVVVEPGHATPDREWPPLVAWVQSTRIGLSAFVDEERLLAWATDLAGGRSAEGVELILGPGNVARASSDAGGLASLELPAVAQVTGAPASRMHPGGGIAPDEAGVLRGNRFLLARRGDDVAFLPENPHGWWEGTSWARREAVAFVAWQVFDDRGLYRPGETAHVKGLVRSIGGGRFGEPGLPSAYETVTWTLQDSVGNEVAKGREPLSATGGFHLSLDLPATMNLGHGSLVLGLEGPAGAPSQSHHHALRVEEFRRPEYEVTVSAGEGPFLVGGHADVSATAIYFAGGPLADADVSWRVTATPGQYQPPGWDAFTFGELVPWWRPWGREGDERVFSHEGRTNAGGEHALRLELLSCTPPRATAVTCEATIQDVNRQAWSGTANLLVHPSELWVGVKAERPFVERGQPFPLELIVTDRDGAPVAGRAITLRAARRVGTWSADGWKEEDQDVVETELTSGAAAVAASLKLAHSGSWRITARVSDSAGRPNETVLLAWVSGAEVIESQRLEQQQVELIPDRKEYRAGEVAKVLVRSPFAPAEALLTLRHGGLVSERRLTLAETGQVIEIPIEERYLPVVTVQIDVVGSQGEGRAAAPAFASGSVALNVTRRSRELLVQVSADEPVVEPGATTTLRLRVSGPDGDPVTGEATVIVADEAVLALAGYELADPLTTFYMDRGPGVSDHHLRSSVELRRLPTEVASMDGGEAGGGEMVAQEAMADVTRGRMAKGMQRSFDLVAAPAPESDSGAGAPPIALRKDLRALALFEPAVQLDADGTASIPLNVPDSLTRYRVMVVAVSGPRYFGRAESTVTARRGLMVRPSLPRFLNFGDVAELPVVIQNQTPKPLDVSVALRTTNADLTGARGYRLSVPADDRVELRFPVRTEQAGTARVQAVAVSGALSDAAELSMPVWTPATTEAFATYGTLDAGAVVQPVAAPADALPQFGELSLTTSSTALFELGDAVLSLWRYRFECSEQLASRLLGVLALRDAVAAFGQLPPKAELDEAIARDLTTLVRRQSWNGDVGLWRRSDQESRAWPWVSVHVAHALLLADAKGYEVPGDGLTASRRLLREIDQRIPRDMPDSCRRVIVAQALHVRKVFADPDVDRALQLVAETGLDAHGLETLAFVLPTLAGDAKGRDQAQAIVQHLRNRAVEEAGTVTFADDYGDGDWLVMHSSRRTDGVILRALLDVDPQSDLAPRLVRGLLDHRVKGAWNNTQENAFILLALDRYFALHEAQPPDFTATAWLAREPLALQEWKGRSVERRLVEVPMRELSPGRAQDVTIAKEGAGRLYWRLGLTWAPEDLRLEPSQHGFVVERTYEGVESPADAWRDDDGTWHVKAGALVRSRVTMVAPARRTHVALVDPLPAGVEALNPALATTQEIEPQPTPGRGGRSVPWWWGPWFQHQNLRDDRAEAFTSYLSAGAWEYAWIGRATTPGRFVVPPAKAEEMYHPETFGRSATDVLVVD